VDHEASVRPSRGKPLRRDFVLQSITLPAMRVRWRWLIQSVILAEKPKPFVLMSATMPLYDECSQS
jgi:hypothetical protein